MKKTLVLCLAMMLALGALAGCGKKAESNSASTDTGIGLELGQAMPDFTVSLTDGTSANLSETLKEKDLVVLNVFASWCGPCEREFPGMESVHQANKDRVDKRPVLSDLRDSGSIEQDADVVMFLHREEYYNKDTEDKNIGEVIISKQRSGPLGTVKLAWLSEFTTFANLAKDYQNLPAGEAPF